MICRVASLLAGALLFLSADIVFASRAELDGRGLPRLLAVDPSNIRLLPGSAGKLDAMGLVDYEDVFGSSGSDSYVLAVVGKGARYGYVLDGETHNLVVAHPSGWGVTLGFSDVYEEQEIKQFDDTANFTRDEVRTLENIRRELRIGLGWQHITMDGRVLEIGLGGTYLDWDAEETSRVDDGTTVTEETGGWRSDFGYGFDVTVQSLSAGGGIQVAARFSYADLNPESEVTRGAEFERILASLDVGWRVQTDYADDVVFGLTSEWRKDSDLRIISGTSSSIVENSSIKDTRFGVFVSGEKEILDDLTVRGGVQGLASIVDTESASEWLTDSFVRQRSSERTRGRILSPDIFLGAGYRWNNLRADVQLRDSISLTSPFLRWAVGIKF